MSPPRALICPYCGETQPIDTKCRHCGGLFEPLSRQATREAMGPWFIRHADRPFTPGCSLQTLIALIRRGKVDRNTVLRGPTTGQFWNVARRVQGISHHVGYCHHCGAAADGSEHGCRHCGASFAAPMNRDQLGLELPEPVSAQTDGEAGAYSRWSSTGSGTISSFASDDALGWSEEAPGMPAHSAPGNVEPIVREERETELPLTIRSLQGRLAGQRTMLRVMGAALGLAIILLAVSSWSLMRMRADAIRDHAIQSVNEPASPATDETAGQHDPVPPANTESPIDAPAVSDTVAATAPASTQPGSPADPLAEIQADIEIGEDAERSDSEREAALQRAITALETLHEESATEATDLDIQLLLERARTAMERVKLGDFFPER